MKQANQWTKQDFVSALCRNEFVPFFQPKFDLITGMSSCVEILARWDHPDLGLLPPSQFIEAIERAGLMGKFTENLLRQSLASVRNYAEKGNDIGMAFNFSPLTLGDSRTLGSIVSMVQEYGIPFDQVTVEVTETATVENFSSVFESLRTLRSHGFKISIDDFGTGYSSLKLLSQMPFTEMKIDRTFIAGVSKSRKFTYILEAMVDLADKLRMGTVAEGIETKAQLDSIRSLGFDVGQGFYFDVPKRNLEQLHIELTAPHALA
jgi:EAL domain-containing protein (putative c-di-GMP-specific phosphodiesterase class I)